MPVICGFNESSRDLLPTIGAGDIKLQGEQVAAPSSALGSAQARSSTYESKNDGISQVSSRVYESKNDGLPQARSDTPLQASSSLNHNLAAHISSTSSERASLDANLPVSDIWDALKIHLPKKEDAEEATTMSGVAAGEGHDEDSELEEEDGEGKFTPWTGEEIELWKKHGIIPASFQKELYEQWKKQIIWPTKTISDGLTNLSNDFWGAKNIARMNNVPLVVISIGGELSEYIGQTITCSVSMVPGGKYVFTAIGQGVDAVKSAGKKIASWALPKSVVTEIENSYNNLPHGAKIVAEDLATAGVLGAAGKVAKGMLKAGKPKTSLIEYQGPDPIFEGEIL